GLMIGALSFGQLPVVFIPAGPMTPGLSNADKAKARQLFAEGKVGRKELLAAESASYHSAGTCTFYGTANTNLCLVEVLGMHSPGSTFRNPATAMRDALIRAHVHQLARTQRHENRVALADIVNEKSAINGIDGLLATRGSTIHAMHIVAI